MAPKRKRAAVVSAEESAPKRQLRSGKEATITESSLTKPTVASRRVQSTRKRVKKDEVVIESEDEELDVISTSLHQEPLAEPRHLSDETNTILVCSPALPTKITEEPVSAKPNARIGRSSKRQKIQETATVVNEEPSTPVENAGDSVPAKRRGRPPKAHTVDETTPPEVPSGLFENDEKPSPAKPKARRGRRPKNQVAKDIISLEEDTDANMQEVEAVVEFELPDVPSKSPTVNTPTRRRSTRFTSVMEVVIPITTCAKAKASLRVVSSGIYVEQFPYSEDEQLRTATKATISSPSKKSNLAKFARSTRKITSEDITPDNEDDDDNTGHGDHEEEGSELLTSSPTTGAARPEFHPSTELSGPLPNHLHRCFNTCKRAILRTLQCPIIAPINCDIPSVNETAAKQLSDLVDGTVLRAEGNSCLLLGPRGSGKSQMIDVCLEQVAFNKPIILRLSGWVQSTDRHALREIALQLLQQTGTALLPDPETSTLNLDPEVDEEENPFLDAVDHAYGESTLALPPSAHLHALIPVLLTLSRPVIVILDAFDLFALHPRQSLLYCLLDTVQNCRASSESRGIAVIGITSRVDTVQLLEKRVKSRFSGRTIRTAPPGSLQDSLTTVKSILLPSDMCNEDEYAVEWEQRWTASIERFFEDKSVADAFNDTFCITRDFKVFIRILTTCVLRLTPNEPYLSSKAISASIETQRSRPRKMHLNNLSYPSLCLLVASAHADTGGHKSFTFEMLYETFRDQVRALASAPVQFNGGSIGMMRCPREVLISAFENLIAAKIFMCTIAAPSSIAKEFIKYRCVVDRQDIKAIIEKSGNTNLKKWLTKSQ